MNDKNHWVLSLLCLLFIAAAVTTAYILIPTSA